MEILGNDNDLAGMVNDGLDLTSPCITKLGRREGGSCQAVFGDCGVKYSMAGQASGAGLSSRGIII